MQASVRQLSARRERRRTKNNEKRNFLEFSLMANSHLVYLPIFCFPSFSFFSATNCLSPLMIADRA